MMKTILGMTGLLVGLAVSQASAVSITGQFVDAGFVAGNQAYTLDITVTGLGADGIYGLDFSTNNGFGFSGSFANTGTDTDFDTIPDAPLTFTTNTALPFAETYFVVSPASILAPSPTIADGIGVTNVLGAAYNASPNTLIDTDGTYTVAFFSTTDGLAPTALNSLGLLGYANVGPAGNQTQNVAIVPEPASLALLGLGGLLVTRRRHA